VCFVCNGSCVCFVCAMEVMCVFCVCDGSAVLARQDKPGRWCALHVSLIAATAKPVFPSLCTPPLRLPAFVPPDLSATRACASHVLWCRPKGAAPCATDKQHALVASWRAGVLGARHQRRQRQGRGQGTPWLAAAGGGHTTHGHRCGPKFF